MARSTEEWVGKTDDAKIPDRVKLRIWLREQGRCHLTGRRILPSDKFEYEHVIELCDMAGYGINYWDSESPEGTDFYGVLLSNALGGNDTADWNGIAAGGTNVTLTGDPFTDAAGGDFSLNSTAGAGAACKGIGYPTVMPGAFASLTNINAGVFQQTAVAGATTVLGLASNAQIVQGWPNMAAY